MDIKTCLNISVFLLAISAHFGLSDGVTTNLNQCTYNGILHVLSCTRTIPSKVPLNLTQVEIHDLVDRFDADNFSDNSWRNVVHLEIIEPVFWAAPHISEIVNNTFHNLVELRYLKLQMFSLLSLQPNAFAGLPRLKHLVLKDCVRLSVVYVLAMFNNSQAFPNLNILQLDGLNNYNHPPLTSLNDDFYKTMTKRNISQLAINSPLQELTFPSDKICVTLEKLDISNSNIAGPIKLPSYICESVSYVDISAAEFEYPLIGVHLSDEVLDFGSLAFILNVFRYIQYLKADAIFAGPYTILKNVTVNITMDTWRLVHVSLQNNMLKYLDCTLHISAFSNVATVELQSNEMTFLNPNIFANLPKVSFVNLSDNMLFEMQTENASTFANLTIHLPELEILDLSTNGLTFLPGTMFRKNNKLKQLYLRNNSLTQIHFEQTLDLNELDLCGNDIHILNLKSIKWLQDKSRGSMLRVNLQGNPLQCACDAKNFLRWVVSSTLFVHKNKYTCVFKGTERRLTQGTLSALIAYCSRFERLRKKLLVSIIPSISVLIIIVLAMYVLHRIRRKRIRQRTISENINLLKERRHVYRYAAFLSYSNTDGDFVLGNVYPQLLRGLQSAVGIHTGLVCIGDIHFRPGYGIQDEIVRCLELSGVFLAVITKEFCASSYCRKEFELAYTMEKPSLLLYRDEIDEESMWPLLRKMFKTYTRIKIIKCDGHFEFQPDVETISNSILQLM